MKAFTPTELHESFARLFTAGDLDALMSLYEPGATLTQRTGEKAVGLGAIREALSNSLLMERQMHLQVRRTFQADDLALICSIWKLRGKNVTGEILETSGQTSDVARRQPDGSWLLVIDVPYGAAAGEPAA